MRLFSLFVDHVRRATFGAALGALALLVSCDDKPAPRVAGKPGAPATKRSDGPPAPWAAPPKLSPGQTFALAPEGGRAMGLAEAPAAGLLDVDLSDEWAPFILSEQTGVGTAAKPNAYRRVFIELANDRLHPDDAAQSGPTRALDMTPEGIRRRQEQDEARARGKPLPPTPEPPRRRRAEPTRNFLEPFGIPPSLSVMLARIEEDANKNCWARLDPAPLAAYAALKDALPYQTRERARRDHEQALADAEWIEQQLAARTTFDAGAGTTRETALAAIAMDSKQAARVERWRRGQARLAAVKATQDRLLCEGLLSPKSRFVTGMFDLATHEALAQWERKNDVFGWGFLEGETLALLQRPAAELHLETFRRLLIERMADAAAIIEDGSVSQGKTPATFKDLDGAEQPVPNLLAAHVDTLLAALRVRTPDDLAGFLRAFARTGALPHLHVAFKAPPKPPYYAPNAKGELELEAEIDRGDIWYDFPWDAKGNAIDQPRFRYPHLTLFVRWNKQRIPLARWRTTIGSWRSELGSDGRVYYKYKNSDVGPRIWRQIVAAPVWVPPEATPAKDLLTRKTLDPRTGPVDVVNTDVIGPGFQSAYGLVMAIHHEVRPGGGLFDNQIRTHGSVDYTSIARRFSHGCHRLVNTRAVRLFGFVLRHREHQRLGDSVLRVRRQFAVDGARHGFELNTRGHYFQLVRPVKIEVLEGRIAGKVQRPITAFVRKPGVDYGPDPTEAPLLDQASPLGGAATVEGEAEAATVSSDVIPSAGIGAPVAPQ